MQTIDIPQTTPADQAGHAHAADLEACLDLINSEELDGADGVPEEHLPTVDDAIAYFTMRGLAHEVSIRAQAESGPGGADAWLQRLYATRAALREVWDAQVETRPPSVAALDPSTRCFARPHGSSSCRVSVGWGSGIDIPKTIRPARRSRA